MQTTIRDNGLVVKERRQRPEDADQAMQAIHGYVDSHGVQEDVLRKMFPGLMIHRVEVAENPYATRYETFDGSCKLSGRAGMQVGDLPGGFRDTVAGRYSEAGAVFSSVYWHDRGTAGRQYACLTYPLEGSRKAVFTRYQRKFPSDLATHFHQACREKVKRARALRWSKEFGVAVKPGSGICIYLRDTGNVDVLEAVADGPVGLLMDGERHE